MKRVTIYDVAKEAGVSLATVSRVINGLDIVREDTRLRVQDAINKLGYKPNAIAQGLALSKTTTLALVVPEASFMYTGQIINGLIDVAKIYNYNIMLHTTPEGIVEINDIIENIIKSRVDGVIIYNDKLRHEQFKQLTLHNFPIVVIGNKISDENIACVYVDIAKATYELVKKYLLKGKTNVVIIEDRKNPFSIDQMILGAQQAFDELNATGFKFLQNYLQDNKHDLVLAYRDSQALATINAAAELNIVVPDDMEVVCIIDTKYNTMVRPQLTGFSIPSYDLGAVAMRMMTKMLHNETLSDKEIELSYLFTPRQSTKVDL